jgi:hypothetical protein
MKPSAVTVYLTSSSLTLEVLTATKDWSRSMNSIARPRMRGSKTTSPFIQSTPLLPVAPRARSRLLDVLVSS